MYPLPNVPGPAFSPIFTAALDLQFIQPLPTINFYNSFESYGAFSLTLPLSRRSQRWGAFMFRCLMLVPLLHSAWRKFYPRKIHSPNNLMNPNSPKPRPLLFLHRRRATFDAFDVGIEAPELYRHASSYKSSIFISSTRWFLGSSKFGIPITPSLSAH